MNERERTGPGSGCIPDATGRGSGEVVLALLAPVDDLDPGWLDQIRVPDQPLRIVASYEAPPGAFPYVPRSDHVELDEAVKAMVMLDRAERTLPAGDPSDVSSWAVVGPTELGAELRRVAPGADRVVVSWPARRGWASLTLRARARWLARRLARTLGVPVHLVGLGRRAVRH